VLLKICDDIDTNRDVQIDRREFEAYVKKLIEKKLPWREHAVSAS
jgi:hypothetical protein